jgi:WYL domain-containing protein
MTKKEIVNRNIGLTFDFLRQLIEEPSLLDKVPNGSVLEFVEKDFSKEKVTVSSKKKKNRKYLQVRSHFNVIDNNKLFQINIEKVLDDKGKAEEKLEKKLSEIISQAIRDRKKMRFYYESSGGKYWRKVEPYLLAVKQNGNLYLTGYEYPSKERVKEKGNDRQGQYLLNKLDLNKLEIFNETFGDIKIPQERIFGELPTVQVVCRVNEDSALYLVSNESRNSYNKEGRKTTKKSAYDSDSNFDNLLSEPLQPYQSKRPSGIRCFKIGDNYILVEFTDGKKYLYNYEKPGKKHVEKMKALALKGEGLSTYINKYVRDSYAAI